MKTKIRRSMMLVLVITLAFSYMLFTLVAYRQTIRILQKEVEEEANYIAAAIDELGEDYLSTMDAVNKNTRLTLIDPEGNVLYDGEGVNEKLTNHSDRPEVREAEEKGSGEDIRMSHTRGKEMYYYARLLNNGDILRVSKTMNSFVKIAVSNLPMLGMIGLGMVVVAWLLASWRTKRLIEPINTLDVKNPLEHPIYEELQPLVEAIDTQNKEKDALADMRKEFSANVSHELKTPLTSISGYAEIMMNGLVRQEDMPAFSERIYLEARHLITLVEDIIKLSRLDEGAVDIEMEDVEIYGMLREICSRLVPQANKKQVTVSVEGEQVVFHGVRRVLDEMLYNICENAIKYNRENGSVNIWVGDTLEGPKVVVEDTGIGIPADEQERIFERFYRVDKSHSRANEGTGLGLSIVKHGARLHGADVSVESQVNVGTRMKIQFPRQS